jgi:hypothetical protein
VKTCAVGSVLALIALVAIATADSKAPPAAKLSPDAERTNRLSKINTTYIAQIKPILQNKCLGCHGGETKFPWYYSVPGVKQYIDWNRAEAKEHLDLSKDFPFKTRAASTEEDLDELVETIVDGKMPPWLYRMAHPESKLTEDEARDIVKWAKESRATLFWKE